LIRLFIKLESAALTSELERPHQPAGSGLAVEVAHTLADQLAKVKKRRASEIQRSIEVRARAVGGHLRHWFESKREELAAAFAAKGLGGVDIQVFVEMPPSDKARWFQRQVIDSAHVAGHWADFSLFAGICQMRVRVEGHQVRYVASLHGAGRDPGVMAVTTFAEIRAAADDDDEAAPAAEPVRTTKDAFRFVHTESVDELDRRAHELGELLEEGLAEALAQLSRRI